MKTLGQLLLALAAGCALAAIWMAEFRWQWAFTALLVFFIGRALAKRPGREKRLRYTRANIDAVNRLLRD
ncbi:hypothetical protein ACMX2H_14080 [Arthrobacter sulfonylureivorans]|uniref:hypothetical protein n=1 Tax=Arthrobacter sulfonylureivorans TaxID=2486855 RepID=UPI0039E4113D